MKSRSWQTFNERQEYILVLLTTDRNWHHHPPVTLTSVFIIATPGNCDKPSIQNFTIFFIKKIGRFHRLGPGSLNCVSTEQVYTMDTL